MESPTRAIRFGGLCGEFVYDDAAFDIDPEIQRMFYGNDAGPGYRDTAATPTGPTSTPVRKRAA